MAWAPPGATLPGGMTLGRKEIRGFDSPGMICSEKELGIGEGADGILILSSDVPIGADLVATLGLADFVFEVNVTPNRSDALSHRGIAREVAALFGTTWKWPDPVRLPTSDGIETPFPVEVRDLEACPRYQATVVRGVRVGPSPLWLRLRLAACGVRSISNLVDVTNYVMLETGHPLHAFDLAKISAPIVVRRAAAGEVLRTLDGVDRVLDSTDIVIADKQAPIALAGVMGGADSEVTGDTTDVLLEAATFDPRGIRKTAKRLGLHSEASHRFERGVDPSTVPQAGARAAALLAELGGGTVASESTDVYPVPVVPKRVTLSLRKLHRLAGFEIEATRVISTLGALGIVSSVADDGIIATVPTFRPDISIEEDLIEEIMRMIGLDQVPARLPSGGKAPAQHPESLPDRARDTLAALGMYEVVTWAFVPRQALAVLGPGALATGIAVKNPISADYEVMRTSLLPGLVDALKRNLARGAKDVALFEVGPVVHPLLDDVDRHHEQRTIAGGILTGARSGWLKSAEAVDFFDAKRIGTELLRVLGVSSAELDFQTGSSPGFLHPGISAEIRLRTRANNRGSDAASEADAQSAAAATLGFLGQLHPGIARRMGIEVPAFYFEIEMDRLEGRSVVVRAHAVPRFPAATRDLSFWIDATVPAAEQERAFLSGREPLLREISILEDFRDPRFVADGRKGMLWSLTYRADERTLTDVEVDAAHSRIVAALQGAFPIQIR